MTVWYLTFGMIAWFERRGIGQAVASAVQTLATRRRSDP